MNVTTRLRLLAKKLSAAEIRFDAATCQAHAGDKWYAAKIPDAVALPKDARSVSRILRFASQHKIPVTARGAGYGYVGGCVPERGGLVLSLARMNKIIEVHPWDFVAVVQPAVITQRLQERVEKRGLYYPPDPASRANCSIGGNIATNAGGPRSLKYGVTADYVLGLEVVLPDGSITRLGGRTHKNKTGFNLTQLFVGSEGMLGIVTEATLKLIPLPPHRVCLSVGFKTVKDMTGAVGAIFAEGFLPSALEVADGYTVAAAMKRTGAAVFQGCGAHMFVELDGHAASARLEMDELQRVLLRFHPKAIERADGHAECERLWQLRREFSYALRDTGLTKMNEDIVVPRGQIEKLFEFSARLHKKHGLAIASFGHAGDGNIHVNIMLDESVPANRRKRDAALDDLFEGVVRMGGVITGEHGIGLAKLPWWKMATSPALRKLHSDIKRAVDPAGILNPGKFV
ncbi:MAG: FAD-binding protein [Pedosphaera sp.]|nr:FAD-binding protein [Pedosphaera sp.]